MPLPSVPPVPVWIPGSMGSAAFNANIRDPFNFLLNPPTFRARHTTAGTVTKNTETFVPWDTVDEDDYSGWSSSANTKYTVQQPGWYAVSTALSLTGTGATGTVLIPACAVNGASPTGFGGSGWEGAELFIPTTAPMMVSSYWEVYCTTGDNIQIACFYTSEPASNLSWSTTAGQQSHVEIVWMGV